MSAVAPPAEAAAVSPIPVGPDPSAGVSGRIEGIALLAIVIAYLAIGALYATRVPPYNAPDEPAHASYVRDLAEGRGFPELVPGDWDAELLERLKSTHFPVGSDVSTIRYESHQPPLYYLMVAPIARAAAPVGERPQLVLVRLATLLIGAAALWALAAAARALFPTWRATRAFSVALAAFVPMHVNVGASVSNDALAELMLSLVLWRSIVAVRDGLSTRGALLLGLLVGLGMLTKLSCYVGLPIAGLAILLAARPRQVDGGDRTGRRWLVRAARLVGLAALPAALLAGPWLARGVVVYGLDDPFGLRRHDQVVAGQPLTGAVTAADLARHGRTLFQSFWGQFGWMGVLMDQRVYDLLAILSALLAVGVILWLAPWGGVWRELSARQRLGLLLAVLLSLGVLLGTVGYNLTYLQPQGRYLFPAMAGIALLAAGGLRELVAPRQRVAVYLALGLTLAALDVVALFRFVVPALGPVS